MPDRIDELVGRASSAQLSQLFKMLDAGPTPALSEGGGGLLPGLCDPAVVADLLAAVWPEGRGGAARILFLALDPAPPLAKLQSAYEQAREVLARVKERETRAATEVLYHAITAAALAKHGVTLGRSPTAERRALYARLARQLADGALGPLFAAAAK